MIAIVNGGNAGSVKKVFDYLGEESFITDRPDDVISADRLVFPGVGNFGEVMKNLKEKKLDIAITEFICKGKPFFGICVGLQVLFEKSEESQNVKGVKGLGILKGNVVRFISGKIPQIGWNKTKYGYVYFVNSYYAIPKDKSIADSTSDYFGEFTASIKKGNVFATQFHPEKSGVVGISIIKEWLSC